MSPHKCKYDSDGGPCRVCQKTASESLFSLSAHVGSGSFLDEPGMMEKFQIALAKAEEEIRPFLEEIEECQRLTAEDYAVTILPHD